MTVNKLFSTRTNSQQGFSILEVIISIAILSIGILAAARMQTIAVRGTSLASRVTTDTIAAQDLIEQVVSAKYDDDRFIDTKNYGMAGLDKEGSAADYYEENQTKGYKLSLNVAANKPVDDSKLIRLIVETQGPGGSKKTTYDFIKSELKRKPKSQVPTLPTQS